MYHQIKAMKCTYIMKMAYMVRMQVLTQDFYRGNLRVLLKVNNTIYPPLMLRNQYNNREFDLLSQQKKGEFDFKFPKLVPMVAQYMKKMC